jgi:predicted  nucleic acid-binding Zn-ribbon protein
LLHRFLKLPGVKLPSVLRSRVVLAPAEQPEDGRVLELFRNRAELKKAYGNAQDEIHRLRDRIKLQEGATARVREMLEALEARLSHPAQGLQALIHYQLRALWAAAQERISILVRELTAQREDFERRQFAANANRRSFDALQAAQRQLAEAERNSADVRAKLADLQQQLQANQTWWRYFGRRRLERRRPVLQAEQRLADADLAAAREAIAPFERSTAPEFPGLSLESRRAINLAAIAFATLIHSRLAGNGMVDRAADAVSRGEPRDLGNANGAAMLGMMGEIVRGRQVIQTSAAAIAEVKAITDQLRAVARYRGAEDTVPVVESLDLARIAAVQAGAPTAATAHVNVLRGDLFGISGLLL